MPESPTALFWKARSHHMVPFGGDAGVHRLNFISERKWRNEGASRAATTTTVVGFFARLPLPPKLDFCRMTFVAKFVRTSLGVLEKRQRRTSTSPWWRLTLQRFRLSLSRQNFLTFLHERGGCVTTFSAHAFCLDQAFVLYQLRRWFSNSVPARAVAGFACMSCNTEPIPIHGNQ